MGRGAAEKLLGKKLVSNALLLKAWQEVKDRLDRYGVQTHDREVIYENISELAVAQIITRSGPIWDAYGEDLDDLWWAHHLRSAGVEPDVVKGGEQDESRAGSTTGSDTGHHTSGRRSRGH